MSDDLVKRLRGWPMSTAGNVMRHAAARIEELEADFAAREKLLLRLAGDKIDLASELAGVNGKLAKAVTELKMLTDVSVLMQSFASHDKHKHNTVVTDTLWAQWSKQLRFSRATIAALKG